MKSLRLSLSLVIIGLISTLSCKQKTELDQPESVEGIYEQLGYGRFVKIEADTFNLYDFTKISCLPVLDGPISVFGDNLSIHNDTLRLKDGINEYKFTRLNEEPDLCVQGPSEAQKKDPLFNFEVLAATFEQHYAYFELRGVNWDSLYAATKSKITSQTTDPELYIILEDMLDSFGDGHIGLDAPGAVERAADSLRNAELVTEGEDDQVTYGDLEIAGMVSDHYLKDNLHVSRSELFRWGMMEDSVGYLQVNLMMGHANLNLADSLTGIPYLRVYFDALDDLTSEAHTQLELEGVKETMGTVMKDLAGSRAILLDVRFNGGGKDEVGMEIIRHFNPERRLVFNKKARKDNGYTEPNNVYLEAGNNPYIKPVYILTSQESASATEIMVLSSLLLENTIRAGDRTEGVFSDVLDKALPNEWEVGLSNELYLDTQGNNYEGLGIPANIDLGYPADRQDFFRSLANDLEGDEKRVLDVIRQKME